MSAKPACNNVKEATKYCRTWLLGKYQHANGSFWHVSDIWMTWSSAKKQDNPIRFDEKRAERVLKFIQLLPHTKENGRQVGKTSKS